MFVENLNKKEQELAGTSSLARRLRRKKNSWSYLVGQEDNKARERDRSNTLQITSFSVPRRCVVVAISHETIPSSTDTPTTRLLWNCEIVNSEDVDKHQKDPSAQGTKRDELILSCRFENFGVCLHVVFAQAAIKQTQEKDGESGDEIEHRNNPFIE